MAGSRKPRRFGRIIRFFKEVRNEMKKVVWPNKEQLISHTSVVIGTTIVIAAFIGIVDFGFSFLLRFFI